MVSEKIKIQLFQIHILTAAQEEFCVACRKYAFPISSAKGKTVKPGSLKIVRVGIVSPIPSSIFHIDQRKSVVIDWGQVENCRKALKYSDKKTTASKITFLWLVN